MKNETKTLVKKIKIEKNVIKSVFSLIFNIYFNLHCKSTRWQKGYNSPTLLINIFESTVKLNEIGKNILVINEF